MHAAAFAARKFLHPVPDRRGNGHSYQPGSFTVAWNACSCRDRQLAVYDGILAAESSLRAELGEDATAPLIGEAREVPALLQDGRRVLIVSARP